MIDAVVEKIGQVVDSAAVPMALVRRGVWALVWALKVIAWLSRNAPTVVLSAVLLVFFAPGIVWPCLQGAFAVISTTRQMFAPRAQPIPPPPLEEADFRMYWAAAGVTVASLLLNVVFLLRKPRLVKTHQRQQPFVDVATEFVMERSVDGSNYFHTPMPSFMAQVSVYQDGQWWRSGMAYRVDEGIVTCWHVINTAERVRLSRGDNVTEYSADDFEHVVELGDVARSYRPPIWMSKAKYSKTAVQPGSRVMAMVHNGDMASMGPVSAANDFGQVKYEGSTTKGFSGSPYYMGKTIFGMHLGAMAVNVGYEGAYLGLILKTESSDEHYLDLISQGEAHQYRISPGDPDEVMVRIRGRYHYFSSEDYFSAQRGERKYRGESALPVQKQQAEPLPTPQQMLEPENLPRPIPVAMTDSENSERPAVPPSTAGLSSSEVPRAPGTLVQSTSGTTSPLPPSGSPSPTPLPEKTLAPNAQVSSFIPESTLRALVKEIAKEASREARKTRPRHVRRRTLSPTLPTDTSPPGEPISTTQTSR
uniref:Serine protease n=1 Tax=Riboviria sp. TaxID=2585031 RepID=A0A8K1U456_9VIRU|nr:MAG: hypothetical protein 2 [Riboviria sp.]